MEMNDCLDHRSLNQRMTNGPLSLLNFRRLQTCAFHALFLFLFLFLLAISSVRTRSTFRFCLCVEFSPTVYVHRWLLFVESRLAVLAYLVPSTSLFDLLKRMRPRMHGQCRTRQHHTIVVGRGRIGQFSADPS